MDKTTKNILLIAVVIIGGAIALRIVFAYWWTIMVGIIGFIFGYFVGKWNRD